MESITVYRSWARIFSEVSILISVTFVLSCSTAQKGREQRHVLILGFGEGEVTESEVGPALDRMERIIEDQNSSSAGLLFTKKAFSETVWSSDVVRDYATRARFDDVIIVQVQIKLSGRDGPLWVGDTLIKGRGLVKSSYMNVQTGESQTLHQADKRGEDDYGGPTGKRNVIGPLLEYLVAEAPKGEFPKLFSMPKLSAASQRLATGAQARQRIAVAKIKIDGVASEMTTLYQGYLDDAVAASKNYTVVARNSSLDAVLSEHATSVSQAFNPSTVAKIGELTGAALLLYSEASCRSDHCTLRANLINLESGEVLRAANQDSSAQAVAIKTALYRIVESLDADSAGH